MAWEPLPDDVAEWMGMDTSMVPFAVELGEDEPLEPITVEEPVTDESPSSEPSERPAEETPAPRLTV